jgi:phenylacetate-coenzyme A ligase PaaK-like adenylate-forming protein
MREFLAAVRLKPDFDRETLLAHARAHSPFYRDRPPDATLDKATLMEHFDAIVTDPRLRRDDLLGRVEQERVFDEYRVMTTSGSSGRKGLFVYGRAEWAAIMAQFLRFNALAGIRPRIPRLRIAAVVSPNAAHMSRRVAQTASIGVHRVLALPVTAPLPHLVERLNAFQPQSLNAYPSIAALLAEEQRAGRLRIAPRLISTSSELQTEAIHARITEAFGVRPHNLYATTEGLWGADCAEHAGIHLFEDFTHVENVDADNRPVPDGQPGAKLLITSLFNRVQPLIRLELPDAVTLTSEPCACGLRSRRIVALAGRSEDVIELDGVPVHPLQFGLIARDRDVVEFQVVHSPRRVRILVVTRTDGVEERLRAGVEAQLRALGVSRPRIEVERRQRLDRSPSGKLPLVVAED